MSLQVSSKNRSASKRITLEALEAQYNVPLIDVAKSFGLSITMLKKICRKFGIQRWPHRQIRSLNRAICQLRQKEATASAADSAELARQIDKLDKKKRLVTKGASSGLQSTLRNAIFLANPEEIEEEELTNKSNLQSLQKKLRPFEKTKDPKDVQHVRAPGCGSEYPTQYAAEYVISSRSEATSNNHKHNASVRASSSAASTVGIGNGLVIQVEPVSLHPVRKRDWELRGIPGHLAPISPGYRDPVSPSFSDVTDSSSLCGSFCSDSDAFSTCGSSSETEEQCEEISLGPHSMDSMTVDYSADALSTMFLNDLHTPMVDGGDSDKVGAAAKLDQPDLLSMWDAEPLVWGGEVTELDLPLEAHSSAAIPHPLGCSQPETSLSYSNGAPAIKKLPAQVAHAAPLRPSTGV
ncbi:unnamed protein product [Chrysoparadoxa australica]